MNTKLLLILILLVLATLVSAFVFKDYLSPSSQPPTAPEKQKTVAVTAQNGTFTPNMFQAQLFETLNLNVTAADANYSFQVAGYPRLDTQLPKGQTTAIKIQSLGIGEYPFTCGNDCSGKITVNQETDVEQ